MVKKCPDPACGFEGDGESCPDCDKWLIEKLETSEGVVCDGKIRDGQPCGKLLTAKHKYCSHCGSYVKVDVIECRECGTNVSTNDQYCWECGVKVEISRTKGN